MLPVTYSDHYATSPTEQSRRSKSRKFIAKPSWLLLSISDMEDKIQAINGEDKPDTFAERAEFYYRRRPQLLALLQDLYNRYLHLADRYTRTLSKRHQQQEQYEEEKHVVDVSGGCLEDAESSLPSRRFEKPSAHELVVSELVMKFVEYEIVVDELGTTHIAQKESKKKMELQKSLLEVLESERVVLANENCRLASECLFMKRKAGELARCVLLGRGDDHHRVFVLGRKIDDLQGQIYELEKRNKDYYNRLTRHDQEEDDDDDKKKNGINIKIKRLVMKSSASSSSLSWSGGEDETTGCSASSTSYSSSTAATNLAQVMKEKKRGGGGRGYGWLERVKNCDVFMMCGPRLDSTCC